ncbi:MAG TPA: matrixin family metalloprotease [Candidatus Thermoplasmatota archaeon]|nr:matrixin family metalloprotease [Candidatus Thermoplasmatota archaeon]
MRRLLAALLVFLAWPSAVAESDEPVWPNGAYNPYDRTPIRVWLDEGNLTAKTRTYLDTVREAMAYWENGGNGAIRWNVTFSLSPSLNESDLVVRFDPAATLHCGLEIGVGCGGYGVNRSHRGIVRLALYQEVPPGTAVLEVRHRSYDAMRDTAIHEFGHALGLPHSDDPLDVMYPESDTHRYADSPDSLLPHAEVVKWMGYAVGAVAAIMGALFLVHRIQDNRAQRRIERMLVEAERSMAERPRR